MKYFLAFLIFLTHFVLTAQLNDDFTDNDFTNNPTWSGDDSVFTVIPVLGNNQLRSNKTIPNSTFYLSTPSTQSTDLQWELFTNLQFNTSSANYVDIYLTSNQANLLSATISGYFIRIGGTTDEISLYKKVAGVSTKIIDGTDGITNSSNNSLKIKATCSATNEWKLERDITGSGNSYVTEGIITDASVVGSSFFGISITQSTASFILKHFFDDIYVGPIIYDLTPPVLVSATAISSTQIDVLFNEPLDQISAENITNYDIQPFLSASSAVLDATNLALVHITPSAPLGNGNTYSLFTNNVADIYMNVSGSQSTQFTYVVAEQPLPGDVIINEFLCDPSPVIGLPEVEFVEIYNRSTKYFNLLGWKMGDNATFGTIQQAWLAPGEYKILCATSSVVYFTGAVGVTSFPGLNNAGDDIIIKDNNGVVIDKISYTDAWYKDPIKKNGGYSIELINPSDPCSGEDNWIASTNSFGGTPGQINSVYNITPDTQNPSIKELIPLSPNFLEVYFNEGMDSTILADAIITTNPSLSIQNRFITGSYPSMFTIQFVQNLVGSQVYSITLENIADCWMNTTTVSGNFALPEVAVKGDILINEILFDPKTGGSDWVELYNNSNKLIDLKGWQFANYKDSIANKKTIPKHFYLKANQYAVVGKDSAFVKQNYPASVPGTFVYSDMPSYLTDSSTVFLLNNNVVMDKVSYNKNWHFKLLDSKKGISLERLDFNGISDDPNNWYSAAEAIGFATPGGKNSQYYPALSNGQFSFTSLTVSPDNDGYEDVLQVNYEMNEPGLLGTFTIYDDRGRVIRRLFNNELLATTGTFIWDGVSDKSTKASIGTYIAVFEAFSLDGAVVFTKTKAFVVAGKL